ncbi:hypothetical protein PtB15_10B674 [Puccinia triticina]|nr:hypothetical protein PtB15_10B674 [Puccinia triticina]
MSSNHTNSHTSDEVPSTPPNIAEISPEVSQSARRESTQLRTPVVKPGFVRTEGGSRRTLSTQVPPRRTQNQAQPDSDIEIAEPLEEESAPGSTQAFTQVTQVSTRTGKKITVDTVQDSDEENTKVQEKSKKASKDGYDHPRLYFYAQGMGPKQVRIFYFNSCGMMCLMSMT